MLVVALIAGVGMLSAALILTTSHANQWQDRANETETALDEYSATALTARIAIDELRETLAGSEVDNAELEERLADLAAEKAAAQDDTTNALVAFDELVAVTLQAIQANDEFASCIRVGEELDAAAGATPEVIADLTADRDTHCSDAREIADAVVVIVESWSE